jgi:hypothetical protein
MRSRVQKATMASTSSASSGVRASLLVWLAVSLLLAVFAAQNLVEANRESCTSDEVVHLPAGLTYILKHDFRLNPEHPPLIKILCALPTLALHPKIDFEDPNWKTDPVQSEFGYRVLYSNDADRMLFWGRVPVVLIAVLLGFFVFRWAQQLYGNASGLFALTLFAFSPNLIAHAHLVTTDVGVSAFLTITFYFLWRCSCLGERKSLMWSAVAMGAALASKFSAVVLFPVSIFLLWWFSESPSTSMDTLRLSNEDRQKGSKRKRTKGVRPNRRRPFRLITLLKSFLRVDRRRVVAVLIFVVFALAVAQLSYLGSHDLLAYVRGLRQVNKNHQPDFFYYLHGQLKMGGWWYYFLVAFLVKATVSTVLLAFIRLARFFLLWRAEWKSSIFLVLPIFVYVAAVSILADNLGVRYLLPVFPLLMIFSSGLMRFWFRRKGLVALLLILLGWHVTSSLIAFPHHLSYFNEFVGGPAHGIDWLDDSNVDWGQELKSLKKVLDERQITHITLISFSPYDNPMYYGIDCTRPDLYHSLRVVPGIYVISARNVARMRMLGFDWMENFPVIANLGYSMFVFKVP